MPETSASTARSRARDQDRVQQEYGVEKWPAVARLIGEHAAGEPPGGSALARVHHRVSRAYAAPGDPLARHDTLLAGRRQPVPVSLAVGGAERLAADLVVDACSERTDLVIELGSGWGWHVLGAWLAGGPRDALYVGAELTAAGREASERLAGLDEDLRFASHAFDYHDPSSLHGLGAFEDAVVFSVHSVEQIPRLHPRMPAAIAGIAASVRCLHFEPVGWQASEAPSAGTSRAYAEHHDYNRDLLEVLRAEEAAGGLRIEAIEPDVLGLNPDNATTLVRWSAGT